MVVFGFCKDWGVEKCTEPVFKMFRKPRKVGIFKKKKRPVVHYGLPTPLPPVCCLKWCSVVQPNCLLDHLN